MNKQRIAFLRLITVAAGVSLLANTSVFAKWSFGVIADNQDATGLTHGLVATATIHQINAQFIAKGVKLVVQVGDELNAPQSGVHGDLAFASVEAQLLYNAGIGFFPMRGNHEAQSDGGLNDITLKMFRTNFPQTQGGGANTFGTSNFNSPSIGNNDLLGLSYSFDYFSEGESARFLVIDDWGTVKPRYDTRISSSYPLGYSIGEQQEWISSRLDKTTRGTDHAFVFAHHNLIGEDHVDCLFGNPNDSLAQQDAFIASLYANNVKYFTSGHEHVYNRSIFTNTTGSNWVIDNNCAPAGPKFLVPITDFSRFSGQKTRQIQLSQEMYNVGFCIYTIDGPRVTVDYYSDSIGGYRGWADGATPAFNFVKKDSWGYSLNGKEFRISNNGSYTVINDNFSGTTARVLNGINTYGATDFEKRTFTKLVTTGWGGDKTDLKFRSEILTLWGMSGFGKPDETDPFTLSMSYDPAITGACALMSQKNDGSWTHSVDLNKTAGKKFVAGPYKNTYAVGTYGIDHATKTVWAVVGHAGTFAVRASADGDQDNDGDVDDDDIGIIASYRNSPASVYPSADLDNDGKITVLDSRKAALLKTVK